MQSRGKFFSGDMTQCHISISDSVKTIPISTRTAETLSQLLTT